ncbi:MAG: hypothetical protein ACOYEV_16935 [Candidatus Nanopelagicales bacterium]
MPFTNIPTSPSQRNRSISGIGRIVTVHTDLQAVTARVGGHDGRDRERAWAAV